MKALKLSLLGLLALPVCLTAATIVVDDFNHYADTADLKTVWIPILAASNADGPFLATGAGVDGSHAMRHAINWNAGAAAQVRRLMSSPYLDLRWADTVSVRARVASAAPLAAATQMTVRIEGTNGGEWQTRNTAAITIDNESWATFDFQINSTDLERVAGGGTLQDALFEVRAFRLRFTNSSGSGEQDVYVDRLSVLGEAFPDVAFELVPEQSDEGADWTRLEITPQQLTTEGTLLQADSPRNAHYRLRIAPVK